MLHANQWRVLGASVLLAASVSVLLSSAPTTAHPGGPHGARSAAHGDWVGSWATALTAAEPTGFARNGLNNQSVRMIVHLSVGGQRLRVRLSHVLGERAMTIGAASVALPDLNTARQWDFVAATKRDLTFGGRTSATMLKGQELLSDPVDLRVGDGEDLIVTLFSPTSSGPLSWHATSQQESVTGPGDLSEDAVGNGFTTRRNCCWVALSGVDVLRRKAAGSIVVLGDSLADGNGTTLDANKRWPDLLAQRLLNTQHNGKVPAVLNAGLSGNRLNHEGTEPGAGGFPGFVQLGTNAGARLDQDVFSQPGVRTVVFDLGIDDIWMNGDSPDAIINAIRQAAAQVRERGLRFVAATLAPYEGFEVAPGTAAGEWTPAKEATRTAVNAYLRSSHEFDGMIDFDAVLRDPANPSRLRSEFDSGDHLHPNDAGNQAMANAVPRRLVIR